MKKRGGRPEKIGLEQKGFLVELVRANPLATWSELVRLFAEGTGIHVHQATLHKVLISMGVVRRQAVIRRADVADTRRYGYGLRHRQQAPEQRYASCLSDKEWERVADLFERQGGRGLPPRHDRRTLLDACCYVVRTGCSWRMLPQGFPHWDTVYKTFRRWSALGKFEQMHDRLREMWRAQEQRQAMPSAAVLDSQSTRGSPQGGEHGYDAGKKVKGRKRSLIVDTLGLLLAVSVASASLQDRDAADSAVQRAMQKYPGVKTLFADRAYAGVWALKTEERHAVRVQIVRSPVGRQGVWQQSTMPLFEFPVRNDGFTPLPKRWVVERTHAWNERSRRLIMHHDRLHQVSEAWVWLAEARLLARRLSA